MHLLLLLGLLPQLVPLATTDENAKVTLWVKYLDGRVIKDGRVRIRSDKGQVILDKVIDNSAEVKLPYGRYEVTLNSFFTYETTRTIVVGKPEVLVILAGSTRLEDTPKWKTSVLVETTPSKKCHSDVFWVKLVSTYSDYSAEQVLSLWGNALFEQIEYGAYIAIVIDGTEIRGAKAFSTRGPETKIRVELSPCQNH